MAITCGKYKHFKDSEYIVYGTAKTINGELCVVYKENYGDFAFWIRPVKMFLETLDDKGVLVKRFKLIEKVKTKDSFRIFSEELKKQSILLKHTETKEKYRIVSVDENKKQIIVAPYMKNSAYLTDSQIAYRMGYDLYIVNGKKIINKACEPCNRNKQLEIYSEESEEYEREEKVRKIIKEQINVCSIDLCISNEFYKPRFKTVDMTSFAEYSQNPLNLWKRVYPKKINGSEGIVLFPNQIIVTCTKDVIGLPDDCAGKLEIKSTYARLALSVTSSDFCNTGWKGRFPLTIKNNGNHIVVIHPGEQMVQLTLIPTDAAIINEYSKSGVFMDDDGTPFRFWRSQTVKHIVSETERKSIFQFYEKVIEEINIYSESKENEKERFESTFLHFYQKKMKKDKYRKIKKDRERLKVIWKKYKEKEAFYKFMFKRPVRFSGFLLVILPILIPCCIELFTADKLSSKLIIWLIISIVVSAAIQVLWFMKVPKYYCTFEKLDFDDIYDKQYSK